MNDEACSQHLSALCKTKVRGVRVTYLYAPQYIMITGEAKEQQKRHANSDRTSKERM